MKSDRLLSIIIILTEKKMMSAPALADLLEVSVRTIYRDIETLNMAGIPIYTTTGKNGGIGILDSYKIDKQLLNLNDITSLLIGLNSINEIMPEKSLNSVTLKINSLLDEESKEDIKSRIAQLKISLTEKENLKSIKTFEHIQSAIQLQKIVAIVYKDRMGRLTKRSIEPYRVLYKGNNWYLQGYCLVKNDFRTFRLNRISHLQITDTSFIPREIPIGRLNEFQFCDHDISIAKLRIADQLKDRFLSLYGEECIIAECNEDCIVQIPIPMNDWGLNHILSFGEECQCLEPYELREALKLKLKKMLDSY